MSRSGYVDDCEHLNLYSASVDRAIAGRRGQAFLRELAEAMEAMPERVLIAEELIDAEGDCCTIGVVCKSRGLSVSGVDQECPDSVGNLVGIASSMAAEIEFLNDEAGPNCETPAARWIRVRRWVEQKLSEVPS